MRTSLDARVVDGGPVRHVRRPVDGQVGVLEQLHGGAFERALGQDEAEHGGRSSQTAAGGWPSAGPALAVGQAVPVPPPYDVCNFLNLLGIEIPMPDEDDDPVARLTVTHDLIAGTGFLWAPVVITLADALCAFGVNHHWPEGATSFTTVDCSANFISSARGGRGVVIGHRVAAPPRPHHAGVGRHGDERDDRAADGVVPLHPADPLLSTDVSGRAPDSAGRRAATERRALWPVAGPPRRSRSRQCCGLERRRIRAAADDPPVPGERAGSGPRTRRTGRSGGSLWCGKWPASSKISSSLPGKASWARRPCPRGMIASRRPHTMRVGTPSAK